MFKHFVGHIYLLDAPPAEEDAQLNITFPDTILGSLDETRDRDSLTETQIERVIKYRREMSDIVGQEAFAFLKKNGLLQDTDSEFLLGLARNMSTSPENWRGFGYLNSNDPNDWDRMLYNVVKLKSSAWDTKWSKVVAVTKAISRNWSADIPSILEQLAPENIDIEEFFKIERTITFKLASLLNDVNELHKIIINQTVDISLFIGKISHAFLPPAVYHLEEYGLPRMIARKIERAGIINFSNKDLDLQTAIEALQFIGLQRIIDIEQLDAFDRYVVRFFFNGISPD